MKKTLKVLFIEDSVEDVKRLRSALIEGGFDLKCKNVNSFDQLVDALELQAWDLIVSDFYLENFSGFDALKIVRKNDAITPFIIVAGNIGEEFAVQVMRAGASDFGSIRKVGGFEILGINFCQAKHKEIQISNTSLDRAKCLQFCVKTFSRSIGRSIIEIV